MWSGNHNKYFNGYVEDGNYFFFLKRDLYVERFFCDFIVIKGGVVHFTFTGWDAEYIMVLYLLSVCPAAENKSRSELHSRIQHNQQRAVFIIVYSLKEQEDREVYSSWFVKYGHNFGVDKSIPVCWPSRTFSEKNPVSSGCPRLKEKQNRKHIQNHIIWWAF